MDIKEKIKQSGHKVYIINSLNSGVEYADLEADLKEKGSSLTMGDLHNYHKVMAHYSTSTQVKPIEEKAQITVIGNVSAVIEQIQQSEAIEPKMMLQMLHRLYAKQVQIVANLQAQYLEDNLVLMNNELKNLETIQKVYKSTSEIKFRALEWDGVEW